MGEVIASLYQRLVIVVSLSGSRCNFESSIFICSQFSFLKFIPLGNFPDDAKSGYLENVMYNENERCF